MGRVTELQIEDFKKITFVSFPLRKGVTEISGPNGSGKSSSFDAVGMWIDGLRMKDRPEQPIRNGARRARIRGRLGEMYVTREVTRTKTGEELTTRITFEPVDGSEKPYPATQKQLYDLVGEHHLDSTDFLKLDARGKFDAFRAFVPGFDFEKAKRQNDADYARRKECNRIAEETSAAAELLFVPPGTPEEKIDEAALVAKLQEAGDHNAQLEARRGRREQAKSDIESWRRLAVQVQEQYDTTIAGIERQIAELQRQVESVKARALKEVAEKNAAADDLEKRLAEAEPLAQPIDTAAVAEALNKARQTNAAVERAIQKAGHAATAAKYAAESATLSAAMAAREKAKREAISSAKLPVPGIEFGDGELLYDGAPFEQASTAHRFRVAVALAVARRPDLRLVWIRDASLLDDATFASLEPLALEFDCDILLETVRPIGQNVVVLENGHIKGGPASAAEAGVAP